MTRIRARVGVLLVAVALVTGCTLQTAGAPKGKVTLHATFDDAQHLVTGHAVKVADVQVGTVVDVTLNRTPTGYRATVKMSIVDSRKIPVGTKAALAQTSLLGENYVQLSFPPTFDPQNGPFLNDGDEIPDTRIDPSLEFVTQQAIEAIGAIETGDLASIVNTLATGIGGKGEQLHQLIEQLAQVGSTFAGQSGDIAAIVDGLGQLGRDLAGSANDLGLLVDNVAAATNVLTAQRQRFIDALTQLNRLAVALNTQVLEPHSAELDRILKELDPVAATLAANRDTIGQLLANLAIVAQKAPFSTDASGGVLIFDWLTGLSVPGGGTVPLSTTGTAAVSQALEPPR
jgi:phospholipid/cholesterol/gamma-HCH transport system substrate-binding protein